MRHNAKIIQGLGERKQAKNSLRKRCSLLAGQHDAVCTSGCLHHHYTNIEMSDFLRVRLSVRGEDCEYFAKEYPIIETRFSSCLIDEDATFLLI